MKNQELTQHWRSLAGCTIAASVGSVGLYLYTIGAFVPALIADARYTMEQLSLASFFFAIAVAICAPMAGILMDRFGALRIIALSFVGEIAALVLLSFSPPRFPSYAACLILLGILGVGTSPPGFARIVSARFDRVRGLALGITICGLGLIAIIAPIGATWLIGHIGWRHSYLMLAIMALLLGTTGILLISSEGTHVKDCSARGMHGATTESKGLTRPLFWMMLVGFLAPALFGNGYLLHLIVLLRERGFTPTGAAHVQAMVGIAILLGRMTSGIALDLFSAPRVASLTFCISALGCALLLSSTPILIGVAAFAIGLTIGAELDIMAYFVSRYFGIVQFARLYGLAYGAILVTVGLSPLLINHLEKIGGYSLALTVSTIGTFVGAVILFFLPDPSREQPTILPVRMPLRP